MVFQMPVVGDTRLAYSEDVRRAEVNALGRCLSCPSTPRETACEPQVQDHAIPDEKTLHDFSTEVWYGHLKRVRSDRGGHWVPECVLPKSMIDKVF